MDSMEFLHAGRIFTLLFVEDLTFADVRAVLDELLAQDAFQEQEMRNPFMIEVEDRSFRVWVMEMRVAIEKL
jgi:hypothetical protein